MGGLVIANRTSPSISVQGKDFRISAANLWLWACVVFTLMLATFGIGAATGATQTP